MLIVISGVKRSGKDSVFNVLAKCGGFTRIAFADPLKQVCAEVFSLPLDIFYDDKLKDSPLPYPINFAYPHWTKLQYVIGAQFDCKEMVFASPRDILQQIGMYVRDSVDKEYWIKLLIKKIQSADGNIAITDARMQNERDALKAIGGTLMLVKKPSVESVDVHISENDLGREDDYDLIINNDGTLSELDHDIKMWYSLKYAR